jgi:hypothetical protein
VRGGGGDGDGVDAKAAREWVGVEDWIFSFCEMRIGFIRWSSRGKRQTRVAMLSFPLTDQFVFQQTHTIWSILFCMTT